MNMTAKNAALLPSAILLLFGLIDFVNRLTVSVTLADQQPVSAAAKVISGNDPAQLDKGAIATLLAWSDAKPKPKPKPKAKAKPKKKVKPVPVVKAVDIRQQVQQAIQGDVSKHLFGDDLLSLKGIFYDGKAFAVVEIENINSKVTQHITFAALKDAEKDKPINGYQLIEIGRFHLLLKKHKQQIKLQLFE